MITHHDSLGIPIIHTNMPRSHPSKYISVSSQSYFVCTRRLSGPPLIHRLWKQLETSCIVCLSYFAPLSGAIAAALTLCRRWRARSGVTHQLLEQCMKKLSGKVGKWSIVAIDQMEAGSLPTKS